MIDYTSLRIGQILYASGHANADGSPMRARVNGKTKTWKTRPGDFEVPMKHGLRDCFYLTPRNAVSWFVSEDEAKAARK